MATDHETTDARLRRVQIAVLAKAPIPSLAKTRLVPALGAMGAARLQRELTLSALCTANEARLGPVTLWCAPGANHRFFRALRRVYGTSCIAQPTGDLGQRMHQAFSLQCRSGPLLLIGTDCPALRPEHLRQAALGLLDGADAVFFPAEDGGYVLVGLCYPQPALFTDMQWSTSDVMSVTRHRAEGLGLRTHEFETLWDVDTPADLARMRKVFGESNT